MEESDSFNLSPEHEALAERLAEDMRKVGIESLHAPRAVIRWLRDHDELRTSD